MLFDRILCRSTHWCVLTCSPLSTADATPFRCAASLKRVGPSVRIRSETPRPRPLGPWGGRPKTRPATRAVSNPNAPRVKKKKTGGARELPRPRCRLAWPCRRARPSTLDVDAPVPARPPRPMTHGSPLRSELHAATLGSLRSR